MEPESVKRFLANCSWNEGGKQRMTEDMDRFYRYQGIQWQRPRYEKVDMLPHIPTEEEVNAVVAGFPSRTIGTLALLLKETGCRSRQAWSSEWTHIDFGRIGWSIVFFDTTQLAIIVNGEPLHFLL
jgi:integrase